MARLKLLLNYIVWWKCRFTRGKTTFSHDEPYHLFYTIAFQCIHICYRFCAFPVREKVEISSINAYAYFLVDIRPARTFWNSTDCLLSPITLDWSRNIWHSTMWNMAVNNISYPIYPLSTRTGKGYITKMIPFFFCSVYIKPIDTWS